MPSAVPAGLVKVADAGAAGFALQNGTPTLLTWTAPNDGRSHRFVLFCTIDVSVAETGGAITVTFTDPAAGVSTPQVSAGGSGAGVVNGNYRAGIAGPGTVVSLQQSSALTLGAATAFAELWAS